MPTILAPYAALRVADDLCTALGGKLPQNGPMKDAVDRLIKKFKAQTERTSADSVSPQRVDVETWRAKSHK